MIGCELDDLPKLFAGKDGATEAELHRWPQIGDRWPGVPQAKRWRIRADSARPETISLMRRRGFNIVPALKGAGSVEEGIEFLKNYDIVVHPRCTHTIDELSFYSWKVDKQTEEVLPELADKNNHVIDALRYAVEDVRRTGQIQISDAALARSRRG
jgi:phage terminase large subunit